MITKENYLKAKEIVEKYEEQLRIDERMRNEKRKEKQREREQKCPEHEYVDASYKWYSSNRMRCIHCGKIINN